ncbi:MAG: complex I subunit 5 family protein [Dethiobacteria bacterium]|nr:complex I subunit 5 family protein [Dethiobacteria bacterium]
MVAAAPEQINTATQIYYSSLPLWITLLPILIGIATYIMKDQWETARKVVSLTAAVLALGGVVLLFPLALTGTVCYDLINFMQMGLFFKVDIISWIFAFLITLVWLLATIFSFAYMDHEHNRRRYYSFLIVTLGATLGVVLAGDFFTLFLFFELMTFSSFVLVIHEQDREAMKAGILYLYLGVAGGLSLLFAIMMLYGATGSVDIIPVLHEMGGQKTAIYICFLIGFGIKAGLVPLHIWLPQAHPVAPSPASALLSGIMIKAGAYGILRVSLILFSPSGEINAIESAYLVTIGNALMWIGIVTMLSGAVMALLQGNMKRILAYSSVSQIGYIATGLGVATFLGIEGGMGFAGAVYHIINHAFFKAGLFMMVGTIYIYTHELELSRLGGMLKKMPLVAVTFIIAAFGIAGIPGFNGYPSKTLIHDSLLIAIKDYGWLSIELAEKIFVLTSAITICYFIKLFRGVFLGPVPEKLDKSYKLPASINIVLSSFALIIVAIGFFPNFILERVIVPAAALLNYEGYAMDHLYHFHFFEWHPLEAMVVVVVIALLIYLPGAYRHWFDWQPPWWLSIYALVYRPVTHWLLNLTGWAGVVIDSSVDSAYSRSGSAARAWCGYFGNLDSGLDKFYEKSGKTARKLAERSTAMDAKLDEFYEKSGKAARKLADRSSDMDSALNEAYLKTGQAAKKLAQQTSDVDRAMNKIYDQAGQTTRSQIEKRLSEKKEKTKLFDPSRWSTKNLNFDTLLMVLVLGVVLFVVFYFGRMR